MSLLKKKTLLIVLIIITIGFLIPQKFINPVRGANIKSYNQASFWYYPWGKSIVHKGVDIFAKEETEVISATSGIVIYKGLMGLGGNVVLVLGPKWRIHYYAHLKTFTARWFSLVKPGKLIGLVGTTGNAAGKPPHLHYSIFTLFPYIWEIDKSRQGWLKMFFINPIPLLNNERIGE